MSCIWLECRWPQQQQYKSRYDGLPTAAAAATDKALSRVHFGERLCAIARRRLLIAATLIENSNNIPDAGWRRRRCCLACFGCRRDANVLACARARADNQLINLPRLFSWRCVRSLLRERATQMQLRLRNSIACTPSPPVCAMQQHQQ